MALQGPYPDPEVRAFRAGMAGDPDPNAHAPAAFLYEVGAPDWIETWGQGCVLFHNPKAIHPLPHDLMKNVSNGFIDDKGRFVVTTPDGLDPFNSMTFLGETPEQHAIAEAQAQLFFRTFATLQAVSRETKGAAWWDGIKGNGEINAYRSDE